LNRVVAPRAKLGAIDAGSNAIRVVIAELGPTELVRIEAERIPVRLGHNAFTRAELDAETVDQAVAAFVHFRQRFDFHGVTLYRAVATSAVRTAANRDVLLHRLYHEAGIELEVIEGEEEARLVRKAVTQAMGAQGMPRAILDLGGGSLEVNTKSGSVWRGHSLPVGTVRLLESFGLDGAIADAEAGMVRRYTATLMHTITRNGALSGTAAITGGNAEALAKLISTDGTASFELADKKRQAGIAFDGRRLVIRWGTPHDDRDVSVGEREAIVEPRRGRLVREAGTVERTVEPVTRAIAREHAARAIATMGCRRETDDEQPCARVAKPADRLCPIALAGEAFRDVLRGRLTTLHESLAPAARGDVGS
jgi:hypothetical protein